MEKVCLLIILFRLSLCVFFQLMLHIIIVRTENLIFCPYIHILSIYIYKLENLNFFII